MTLTTIKEALNPADMEECYAIRTEVFCGEQMVSREIEFDGLDDTCRHYLAWLDALAVGTARVRPLGDGAVQFERVAVLKKYRGKDIGRTLMERILIGASDDGYTIGLLHAQYQAGAFYRKLGFAQEGGEFLEAGIRHIRMKRQI